MSYIEQTEKEIREAYVFLREKNMNIPSDTLQFMLYASLEKLKQVNNINYIPCCKSDSELLCDHPFEKIRHIKDRDYACKCGFEFKY